MYASKPRLDEYLRSRLRRALDELNSIDADALLGENTDVLVAELLAKYLPKEIVVDWDSATRTGVQEVTTQVPDYFDRQVYTVPASRLVVSVPVFGTAEMLDYQASTYGFGGEYGKIKNRNVVIEIVERTLETNAVLQQVDRVKQDVEKRAAWANADLRAFLPTAEQDIRSACETRRQRILNDRNVEDALGIPVRTSSTPRPPIPAKRKQVSLQVRKVQANFVPEPVLEDAIYQDVLEAVRAWANSLERTPGVAVKLNEEEIRDLLLANLNSYWKGEAGGELFNGSGKTDILIRHGDRNAFIAECKIWRGAKSVANALDQLLRYLVWRDSKAALIIFIETKNPAKTVENLHAAIEEHPAHTLTKGATNPSKRADYIVTADDEGRRVSLAVVPVVIQAVRA
ncbi:MAG: hypothetical protein ACRCYU_23665 [Nocardioides sp.]